MRAVDTNVLIRYVTQDDPRQASIATELLREPCFIADTVLIETAWVLASIYRLDRVHLAATLARLIELPSVTVADPEGVTWAIGRFAADADFADMMHLVAARHTDRFASFEKHLATLAGTETPIPIERLA